MAKKDRRVFIPEGDPTRPRRMPLLPWIQGSKESFLAAFLAERSMEDDVLGISHVVMSSGRHGVTCQEIEDTLGRDHSPISARFSELKRTPTRLFRKIGSRSTRSGGCAGVWMWALDEYDPDFILAQYEEVLRRDKLMLDRVRRIPSDITLRVAHYNLTQLCENCAMRVMPNTTVFLDWLKTCLMPVEKETPGRKKT